MIRLIALDLDGTVLDSHGKITRCEPRGHRARDRCRRRGSDCHRPPLRVRPADHRSAAGASHAHPQQRRDRETQDSSDGADAHAPVAAARGGARSAGGALEHRASAALIFDRPREGQVVFEAIDWNDRRHRLFYEANRPFVSEQSPLEDALTEDPVQLMFTGGCAAMRRLFHGLEAAATPDDARIFGRAHRVRASRLLPRRRRAGRLLEGRGARRLGGSVRGLPASEVMAVGDNLNDLEMLEFAGTPVVMANAIAELKTRGWAATASNDEAGVAQAIETFVLAGASNPR